MGMLKKPKTPKLPTQPALPAQPTEQEAEQRNRNNAAIDELRRDRRRGAVSNILTGEGGLSNLGGVVRRGILGG
jgi:hypothetical protein